MHKHQESPDEIIIARDNVTELFGISEESIFSQYVLLRIVMNRHAPIRIRLAAGGVLEFPEYWLDCRP